MTSPNRLMSARDRVREVAVILAAGLLQLRTPPRPALMLGAAGRRPLPAATSGISGEHVPPQELADSPQKLLDLSAPARPDPHAG